MQVDSTGEKRMSKPEYQTSGADGGPGLNGEEITDQQMVTAALAYARRGWPVLALHTVRNGACTCAVRACGSPGKHPRRHEEDLRNGVRDATTDEVSIKRWWDRWPAANIGIATGRVAGFIAMDIDPRHGGDDSLDKLLYLHGRWPETVEAITGGGGRHVLFRHPGGTVRNMTGKGAVAAGIEIKGDGGYIVAAPSLHMSGQGYSWDGLAGTLESLIRKELTPLPDWLRKLLEEPKRRTNGARHGTAQENRIQEGQRNLSLTSLAGSMRRRGMTGAAIKAALLEENRQRCNPPLPEAEVRRIAESVASYQPAEKAADPGQGMPTAKPNQIRADTNLSDLGNARRLVALHGTDIHYSYQLNTWFIWDGTRWKEDGTGEIERMAKTTVCSIYREAGDAPDDKRKALASWAQASESAKHIANMIRLAQSEPGIALKTDEFNSDRWLFNCQSGTVDLKSGELRPHRREDLITKLAPVQYSPGTRFETWDSFIEWITNGDVEYARFLQRAVGYSLTGDIGEEVLFFIHGPAAAGKSTFLEAIKATFGDYARTADFEAFLKRQQVGSPRNDIARLAGARFVISIEVDEGKSLAEGLVKMLTGGDTVTARFLHKEAFEFLPAFKLWLAANQAPRVRDDDEAMWRRILRVPLQHVIPKGERDKKVKTTLKNTQLAGPAILAWAVQGCISWQRQGLGVPQLVEAATESYRTEMDPLRDFLAECCILHSDAIVPITRLWQTYQTWAKDNGERRPVDRQRFNKRLEARGLKRDRKGKNRDRVWLGIGLAAENHDVEQNGTGGQRTETDSVSDNLAPYHPHVEELVKSSSALSAVVRQSSNGTAPQPKRCYLCRSNRLWLKRSGDLVCARCHPPASPDLVVEWVEVL